MIIFESLLDTIGNTPMIKLNRYSKKEGITSNIIAKLEYFNPTGSIKARVALAMIDDAEKKGILKKDSIIVEPTSGNTGIGLAFVGTLKGYKVILTMPETMSEERKVLLKAFGAEIVLTEGKKGMLGAIDKAKDIVNNTSNAYMPDQFSNINNVRIHNEVTAREILRDTNGNIDIFVCGVGTGGTLTGIGSFLKKYDNNIKIIAVEPKNSAVLSGEKAGIHKIQGIGAGFIPKLLDLNIIDEVIQISDDEAYEYARKIIKYEGLMVGISSGASLAASTIVAKKKSSLKKNIVTIFADTGERYLSSNIYSNK